jgi:putative transposase
MLLAQFSGSIIHAYVIMDETPYRLSELRPHGVELGIGHPVIWDGKVWIIHNLGESSVAMRSEQGKWVEILQNEFLALVDQGKISQPRDGEAIQPRAINSSGQELLARASPKDYEAANLKSRLLKRYLAGETPEQLQTPYRTLHDWQGKWEQAEREYGIGYLGLLPKYQHSGNTTRKLDPVSLEKLQWSIENDYETESTKGTHSCLGATGSGLQSGRGSYPHVQDILP